MDESIENSTVRGSNGGNARKEKLSPERRKEIAKEAAKKRWDAKRKADTEKDSVTTQIFYVNTTTGETSEPSPKTELAPIPDAPEEKHCPACLAGESLEEGEGTHILGTVEHPVTLPAAFADAETTVAVSETHPAPPKHPKRQAKPMPAELKKASSYAEKRLPKAIQEKADLAVELAKRETEIQELVRVLQALGGQVPVGVPPVRMPYQSQLPPPYPEYQNPTVPFQAPVQGATPIDIPAPPRPMRGGRAGVADAVIQEFQREIAEG